MSECSINHNSNNKIDLVEYTIYINKLKKGEQRKIVLIADLHDYFKYKKKTKELAKTIKDCNPHHIVIAGDIIQGKKWTKNTKLIDFSKFLKDISQVAPVFISQGNHDLVGQNNNNKAQRDKIIKKLENIRLGKIFVLINDLVTYDNFDILGYTPDPKIINGLEIQEHGIAHDMFIKEFNEKGIKIPNSKNIIEFVGHNPHLIARSENGIGLGRLCKVDTFYTGHLHNGYRRSKTTKKNPDKYLDYGYVERLYSVDRNGKIIKKSINPFFYGKTALSRGIIYIDDNSQRKILQLRNNSYYINESIKDNKADWKKISFEKAKEYILKNNLHSVVIAGGIRKFFGFSIPGDLPEVTIVNYIGN